MNDKEFEAFVRNLQRKIEKQEEETYSQTVIQEYRNPNHFGMIEHPEALGVFKGPCGDTIKISLQVENETIKDARFWTDGCGATVACGNMLCKVITGKTVKEAACVSERELREKLNDLPDEHRHCATLAIKTLQKALENYKRG